MFASNRDAPSAESLMGAIAAASLGVAGTLFSITIAALTLAAGQMGPRLLRAFVDNRVVQASLGVFVGTYAYALVVLRAIRVGDAASGVQAFVPHLAVSFGMLLAFLGVGTLITFLHGVARAINVQNVIATVDREMHRGLRATRARPGERASFPPAREGLGRVRCDRRGYVEEFDDRAVAEAARRAGALIHIGFRPGDFLLPSTTLALVDPPELAPKLHDAIVGAIRVGPRRTIEQDPEFAVRGLVEVAVRALSPGINDPYTALAVLDHLGGGLSALSEEELFDGVTRDRAGTPRVVRPTSDYDGIVDTMFHMIREYGAGAPAVAIRMLEVFTPGAGVRAPPRPPRGPREARRPRRRERPRRRVRRGRPEGPRGAPREVPPRPRPRGHPVHPRLRERPRPHEPDRHERHPSCADRRVL